MNRNDRLPQWWCAVGAIAAFITAAFAENPQKGNDRTGPAERGPRSIERTQGLIDIGPFLPQLESSLDDSIVEQVPQGPLPDRRMSVLVHFEEPHPNARAVAMAKREEVKTWAKNVGGITKYEYETVLPNVINLRDIPESRLNVLRAMPGVVKIEEDRVMRAHLTVSTPLIRALQSQITGAGHSADGNGVRVCIIDTGIDSDHLMYADRIDAAAGRDFVNNDNNPEDDEGHGSHVAGISVGGTGLSLTRCSVSAPIQGVAPEATLIGIKVLDQNGSGSFSDIIAGINYGADQSPAGGRCDVINMSLGGGAFGGNCDGDSAAIAANNAVDAGVVVVASSGNECNANAMGTPACASKVIAVGATYDDDYSNCEFPSQNSFAWCCDQFCFNQCTDNSPAEDSLICFSNASTTIDVVAPGCITTSASNSAGGGSVVGLCGTSQASPHVAGLAALILSKDGTLTPTDVRQIIRDGAIDMGPAGFDTGYGWGRIDAINSLDLVSGGCSVPADCDDGLFCNGAEDCVAGSCVSGTPPSCNDGVGCTDDSCNEGTDSCDNVVNNGNCDDGLFCNGSEACHATLDCQSGTAPNCDDGVGCTMDSCNEGTDSCDNVPSDGLCDDGQFCNGNETCHATLDCQAGSAPNCDDGVSCTDDSCNETTDSCDNTPNDANCDDSVFCNGSETCHATLDCQAGGDPCPGQICDEGTDTCNDCIDNSDCDDGSFCNGAEVCSGGTCQAGAPPNCNDGVGCTDDSCNESTDSCDNIPNDGNCDDGQFCNGSETCHSTLDCQGGSAPNCDDGVGCTDDSCNEGTDSCDNVANNGNCDDGAFCNGAETCHASLDCQAGTPPSCDDGVSCTDDSCNSGTDSCDNITNDANCDDGQFCNGVETCSATLDCQAGSDPCPGQSCNEGSDTCEAVECVDAGDCNDGNGCTTDSCVDNVCVNDCPGMVTSYPYFEDFEAGQGGWSNVGGDVFDWTRDANGTPSSNTGPSGDHTTGSGWYMYIETSSPRVQGDFAILEGPCLDLTSSSTADLTFWYHMFGATIGTLDVEVSDDCSTWTNVWTLSGDQGNGWFQTNVNLDAFTGSVIRVRFIGTRGSSFTGDIAIDDISVDSASIPCSSDPECDDSDLCTNDACVSNICQNTPIDCDDGDGCTLDTCSGGVCSNVCPATVDSFPDSEDYEAGTGDWTNVGGDDIDWTRNSGGTPSSGTGPSGDHTTGSGWYMYIEASSPNYPSMTAILEGPCVDLTGASAASLSFWYHMLGSSVGTLYLEASDDCSSWVTEWSLSGDQGSAWQQANVDLSAWSGSVVSLRFRGVTSSSWQGDICIDDLLIDASVASCSIPADCDDGLFCNGVEDCVGGNCVAGTPVDCSDGVGCTDDTCNEGTDSCDNTPNNGSCDDGLFCNGAETCHATLDCQAGSAVDCDDGVGCTDDSCNEGTDSCDIVANDGNCPDDGLFCNGTEFCDAIADCSSTGDPCNVGEVCNETTDTCDPSSGAKLESGTVAVGSGGTTVNLVNSYASPVIVCSVHYNNNTIPVVTRVSGVTSTSFDVRLQNAGAGSVSADTVSYLVVEEGVWTVDGVDIEAQLYNSAVTDENNSWVAEAQSYGQSYTDPVVLGQVMSENDADWSVFWCQGSSRNSPPSSSSLRTGKTVCEDPDTTRANETVGFIVIEAGHGTINGIEYEAALGADSVRGVTNSPPYNYSFSTSFGSTPGVAIVTMAAVDGGNGGWAMLWGASPLSSTTIGLAIDEDAIGDSERNHTTEQVGYVVFEGALVYP